MEELRFPENTSIKDFAYPESNPLRFGNFPQDFEDYEDYENYEEDYEEYDIDGNIEINQRAIALFDFQPENDNEVGLFEGQIIWISYRHGQGWLVAEDPETGENGLVPEEYVEIFDDAKPYLTVLDHLNNSNDHVTDTIHESHQGQNLRTVNHNLNDANHLNNNNNNDLGSIEEGESDWVDTDDEINDVLENIDKIKM